VESVNTEAATKAMKEAVGHLKAERSELDVRIAFIEGEISKMNGSGSIRRGPGRPPGSKNKPKAAAKTMASGTKKKKKRNWSPEARAAAAERMRKTWAKRKRAAAKEARGG